MPGHWAEDFAWPLGFIFIAALFAGLLGFFIFIRRGK
jgi:hypothetical protein